MGISTLESGSAVAGTTTIFKTIYDKMIAELELGSFLKLATT